MERLLTFSDNSPGSERSSLWRRYFRRRYSVWTWTLVALIVPSTLFGLLFYETAFHFPLAAVRYTSFNLQLEENHDLHRAENDRIAHAEIESSAELKNYFPSAPATGENLGSPDINEKVQRQLEPREITRKGECDLFDGEWEHDPEGPLYSNWTCPFIQENQNCLKNGRPDTQYLHWRWKPRSCDLPRFHAKSFLDKARGKVIGFVGDSIARNQMQSLLCLLSQVEMPINIDYPSNEDGTHTSARFFFKEQQLTLAFVWSPFLLKQSGKGDIGFKKYQRGIYMDALDPTWISALRGFNMTVFMTGQWYSVPSVYIRGGKVIGCQGCPGFNLTELLYPQAYRAAVRQTLELVTKDYNGVTIIGTFPPAHFENGTWEKGGYCKRELPLTLLESEELSGDHNNMHDIVMEEFNAVVGKNGELKKDHTRLEILDVTKVTLQRADAHPGKYRLPRPDVGYDPKSYFPNDCLHWCLPGPPDALNQLVSRILDKHTEV